MKKAIAVLGLSLMMVVPMLACASETTEVAPTGPDPSKEGVLVGVTEVDGMVIQFELEPAKAMWMFMNGMWMEMEAAAGEIIHVEVKLIDPGSADRIATQVGFKAVNEDNGGITEGSLHPMWGGSGLHYAMNSALSGDGTYNATVTVEPPTFARSMSDKDKWMNTIQASFNFKLQGGLLVEVSAPEVSPVPKPESFHPHDADTLPVDPSQGEVLIGEAMVDGMAVQLILEPAKAMWMEMGGMWMEMEVAAGEIIHVEVKLIDPGSNTRVSFTQVKFEAVNQDTGEVIDVMLHAMWGGSGLHYALNSALLGDGTYEATLTIDPPTFARSMSDKDKWSNPIVANYHFEIVDGQVVETGVS